MRTPLLVAATFAFAAHALAAAPVRPSNAILLIVDDLRADRLGVYGGGPTPAFDAFARESVFFENAFSRAGWTLPSVSSILTGLYPTVHGAYRALAADWPERLGRGRLRLQPGNSLPASRTTLAATFHAAGYRTEAVVSCPFQDPAFGFGNGFDDYDALGGSFGDVNREVLSRLDRLRLGGPFFLYIHVNDAHVGAGEGAEDEDLPPAQRRAAEARYRVQVSSVDEGFHDLIAGLRARGLLENTVVAVAADHGEEFWEHGVRGHGASPYDTALHVPMAVRLPGGKGARRVATVAQTVDLFPALLAYAGVRGTPPAGGISYSEIYPHTPPFNDALTAVAVRTDEWKFVWRPDGADELYRIKTDPAERTNVAAKLPEVAREFRVRTDAWRETQRAAAARQAPIPGAERFLPAAEAESLRRAGYLKP